MARKPRIRGNVQERAPLSWASEPPTDVASRIDEENGILKGVLILGHESKNNHGHKAAKKGTRYTKVHERINSRLEGMRVNFWHDRKPNEKVDASGILRNTRVTANGNVGDLHLLKSHPEYGRVMEAAKKGMDLYQLSINSVSVGPIVDGVWDIDDMPVIRSVDIVDRGGTTGRLFEREGETDMKTTIADHLKNTVGPKLTVKQRKVLARVLEDTAIAVPASGQMEDTSADGADEGSPADQLRDAFANMCWDIITDDSLDAAACIKQLQPILEHRDAVLEGTAKVTDTGAGAGAGATTEREDDKSLLAAVGKLIDQKLAPVSAQLKTLGKSEKSAIAKVCERFQYEPSAEELKTLEKLEEESLPDVVAMLKANGGGKKTKSAGDGGGQGGGNNDANKVYETGSTSDIAKSMLA